MTLSELSRVQKLRSATVDGESSAEDVETVLRSKGVRVSVAGRGGQWIAFLWWPDGRTTRGMAGTFYEAIAAGLTIDVRERAKRSWENWDDAEIKREFEPWPCPACGGTGRDGASSAPCPECLKRSPWIEHDQRTRRR